jgi:hypothetical protein
MRATTLGQKTPLPPFFPKDSPTSAAIRCRSADLETLREAFAVPLAMPMPMDLHILPRGTRHAVGLQVLGGKEDGTIDANALLAILMEEGGPACSGWHRPVPAGALPTRSLAGAHRGSLYTGGDG